MRKKLFAAIVLFLFAPVMFAVGMDGKFGIELRGGYAMINPAVLNTNLLGVFYLGYPNVYDVSSYSSVDVSGSKLGAMALGDGSLQFFVTPNVALSLKSDFLSMESTDTVQSGGVDQVFSHIALNVLYIGVGGRYYIGIDGAKGFFPYIGADAGMFLHMDSFWETGVAPTSTVPPYTNANDPNMYSLIDFKDSFFGANIEVGAQYMFTKTVGVSLGLGYRIASSPVAVSGTTSGVFNKAGFNLTAIDLSGIYVSAGLNFCFGGSGLGASTGGAATEGAAASTGMAAKYEQAGDSFFTTNDYAKAIQYYGGALRLDKGNNGLYKKIGKCYYYMKDMVKAKQYLGYYLKLNPGDEETKKWMGM